MRLRYQDLFRSVIKTSFSFPIGTKSSFQLLDFIGGLSKYVTG